MRTRVAHPSCTPLSRTTTISHVHTKVPIMNQLQDVLHTVGGPGSASGDGVSNRVDLPQICVIGCVRGI